MPSSSINVFLRLLNGSRFEAGLLSAAGATRGFAREVQAAGTSSSAVGAAGHAGAAGMYALGHATRLAGYGVGALGAATIGFGFKFNATMEQSNLAFSKFAGNAKQTKTFINDLFEIAAKSPFTFKDVTTAGRRLLAFGFNVKETTGLIKTLSDVVSYTGGNADATFRLAKAFGDIHAKGRLMQQEVNQLANVGIPAYDILRKKLHLTADDMRSIGHAGIRSDKAIKALKEGLDERYGGGAQKYAKTLTGQFDKAKDYGQRAAGALTKPLFDFARDKILPWVVDKFREINKWASGPGFKNFIATVGPAISAVFKEIVKLAGGLIDAIKPAMPFVKNVILPLLKGFAIGFIASVIGAIKVITVIIKGIATALGWLGEKLKPLKKVFEVVGAIISFVFGGVIVKAISWLGKFGGAFKWLAAIVKLLFVPVRIVANIFGAFFRLLGTVGSWVLQRIIGIVRTVAGVFGRLGIVGRIIGTVFRVITWPARAFARALVWVFNIARKVAGFIAGAVVAGVRKLGGAFRAITGIVRSVWRGIRTAASGIFNAVKDALGKALSFLASLPGKFLRAGKKLAIAITKGIVNSIGSGIGFAGDLGRKIADWLNDNTPLGDHVHIGIPGPVPDIDFDLPSLYTGGTITSGGLALVGEKGPEIVRLPSGAQVVPMTPATARIGAGAGSGTGSGAGAGRSAASFAGMAFQFRIPVYMNGRMIAEGLGDYVHGKKVRGG